MITVPRIDHASLTPEIFGAYQKTGTPVIISRLLDQECDWNLEYLCKIIGDCQLPFRTYVSQQHQDDKRQLKSIGSGTTPTQMIFKQYADMLRSRYAHEHNITLRTYPIKNTVLTNAKLAEIGNKLGLYKAASGWNLHIAPGGYNSVLHYDAMDGTLIQMHGAKKVILFPPSQTYNLYPFPIYTHVLHGLKLRCWFSQVYPENPSFAKFPKLKLAFPAKLEVTLTQGEMLYIPVGWWHDITALGTEMVCSVNRFWRVYPTSRAVFCWSRWRSILGTLCAIPYNTLNGMIAYLNSNIDVV